MTTNANTPTSLITSHPPLAHDAQGCKLAVPEGAMHWRILRHTTGRPKIVLGPDMQPGRFGLDLTHEQLLDLCGPGKYRVEALDEFGRPLACVTTVTIGGDDASGPGELVANTNVRATSDARVMLETIAQMSRAHSESLQSLATAQADWIKTLANAKQIPRNAAPLPPQQHPAFELEARDPDPWWIEALKPAMPTIVMGLLRNIGSFLGLKQPEEPEPVKHRNASPRQLGYGAREANATTELVRDKKRPSFDERRAAVLAVLASDEREAATNILDELIRPLFAEIFVQSTPEQAVELVRGIVKQAKEQAS